MQAGLLWTGLASGMASFSLISTGVLWMVRPIAMMLLFFSIAYPAKYLCVSIKMIPMENVPGNSKALL